MRETKVIRKPMQPIVVSVDTLQLNNFRRWPKEGAHTNDCAICDLFVGEALVIKGLCFYHDENGMSQYWGQTRPNVSHSRLHLHQFPNASEPLRTFLAVAIHKFAFSTHGSKIISMIKGESDSLHLPSFKPQNWKGQCLNINFKSITAFSFQLGLINKELLYCGLQLDQHLTFYEIPIYDGKKWQFNIDSLLRPDSNQVINDPLKNEGLREHGRFIHGTGRFFDDTNTKFVMKTDDYNLDGPPSNISIGPFTTK